jgi:hypothetical protein
MDSLTITIPSGEEPVSSQYLHVYRHVDSEKLQSNTSIWSETQELQGFWTRGCVSSAPVLHETAPLSATLTSCGVTTWIV